MKSVFFSFDVFVLFLFPFFLCFVAHCINIDEEQLFCALIGLTSEVSKEKAGLRADSSESGEGEEPRMARWRGERAECSGLS